jgi:hypothetical protein
MNIQASTKEVLAICGEMRKEGTFSVVYFDSSQRILRALKTSGICLLIVALCCFIPGAHFILVPLGVMISPFVIYRRWRQCSEIESVDVRCAVCDGELTRVTTQERYPLFENCTSCHRENRILPRDSIAPK